MRYSDYSFQKLAVILIFSSLLMTSGCQTSGSSRDKEAWGTGLGAGIGVLAGKIFGDSAAAMAIGGLVGAVIGNRFGAHLDEQEQKALASATQEAATKASTGEKISWSVPSANSETKASGWVVPTSDSYVKDGETCRDIQQVAMKNGKKTEQKITMCQTAQGSSDWEIPKSS